MGEQIILGYLARGYQKGGISAFSKKQKSGYIIIGLIEIAIQHLVPSLIHARDILRQNDQI